MNIKRMWHRLKCGKPIIVVSGLPRSGTSMMMQMLTAGGIEGVTDKVRIADRDNPKGYFELERIKDLEQDTDKSYLTLFRGKAVKIISFLLKSLPPQNFYKIVFMERNLEEVLASQNKMLAHRGEDQDQTPDHEMKDHYRSHLIRTKWWLKHSPHCQALILPYHQVLTEPAATAKDLEHFLGLRLNIEAMVKAVDPALYRNRSHS